MCGHLVEISVLDGTNDIGADMERTSHGDEIDPFALTRFFEVVPV